MTGSNFSIEQFGEGFQAAMRDEPFSQWTSEPWQRGWMLQRRQQAAKRLDRNAQTEISGLLESLTAICAALRTRGDIAIDLAQATALRTLDGQNIWNDPPAHTPSPGAAPCGSVASVASRVESSTQEAQSL